MILFTVHVEIGFKQINIITRKEVLINAVGSKYFEGRPRATWGNSGEAKEGLGAAQGNPNR